MKTSQYRLHQPPPRTFVPNPRPQPKTAVGRWIVRIVHTLYFVIAFPFLAVLYLVLGCASMKGLGRAMVVSGMRLQRWHW